MTTSTKLASFQVSKELAAVLKLAAKVTVKRSFRASLGYIQLIIEANSVTVQATDLQVWYSQNVKVVDTGVEVRATFLIAGDAVKSVKPGTRFDFFNDSFSIGAIAFKQLISADEYPEFPAPSSKHSMIIEQELGDGYFEDLVGCSLAASISEVRPMLTGICHRNNYLVATDGLRLHLAERDHAWPTEMNVPAEYADLLQKIFGGQKSVVRTDGYYVEYWSEGRSVTVRLIDGNYPDTTRIVPKESKGRGTIPDVKPWIAALDQAVSLYKQINKTRDKSNRDLNYSIHLGSETGETITLSVRGVDAELEIDVPYTSDAKDLDTTVNALYLKDALNVLGDGTVIWHNGTNNQPLYLIGAQGRKALVSPIVRR